MADINATHDKTRSEVADYLREFADQLDSRGGTETGSGRTDATGAGTAGTGTDASVSGDAGRHTETGASGTTDPKSRRTETATDDIDAERAETIDTERAATARRGGKVTIIAGNESATINPPERVRFDVSVDTDSSMLDAGRDHSATFTISWDAEAVEEDDELRVE